MKIAVFEPEGSTKISTLPNIIDIKSIRSAGSTPKEPPAGKVAMIPTDKSPAEDQCECEKGVHGGESKGNATVEEQLCPDCGLPM